MENAPNSSFAGVLHGTEGRRKMDIREYPHFLAPSDASTLLVTIRKRDHIYAISPRFFISFLAYSFRSRSFFITNDHKKIPNGPEIFHTYILVLCDTHDTSILIVDTYATILVSPMSRYTAVYRSSTKYRETAQVSRVSSIPCSSYHLAILATCTLQACNANKWFSKVAENHSTTMSAWLRTPVNKYSPIFLH